LNDGDCANEVSAAGEMVGNASEVVLSDGNPTNEVQSAVRLFRAVSEGEFLQIMENGSFQEVAQSASGKYFATTAVHAASWGEKPMGHGNFRVIQVDYSTDVVAEFFPFENLDQIGPAFYVTIEQANQFIDPIIEAAQ
jgi:hypothetical protein